MVVTYSLSRDGIPSRVAIGLVYVQQQTGFGFHMWVEVYINQRWVAIDPTWKHHTFRDS